MADVEALAALAARQHGAVSLRQIRDAGISPSELRTLVSTGVLLHSVNTVYLFAGSPHTWRQQVSASCLAAGSDAVAGHRTAACLWALDRFRTARIELSVQRWERRHLERVVVHESKAMVETDRTTVDGLPVTTVEFTLLEMARHIPEGRLGSLVDDAVKRELATYESVAARFTRWARRGRAGSARMRRVLEVRPSGIEIPGSPFEVRVEALLDDAGFPPPAKQHVVHCGTRRYVVDLAWPESRLILECDGWRYHASISDQTRDSIRRNDLEAAGWTVMNLTWEMLRDRPGTILRSVGRHLRTR